MRTATATRAASTEPFAEHRKFLEDEFEIGVGLEQLDHVGQRALAVAAIVVEELDHGDLALRVAEHDLVRRGEQRRFIVADRGAMLLGFGVLLALVQLRHDVLHHLGVRHQIVLDDALDFRCWSAETACACAGAVAGAARKIVAAIKIATRGLDVI